MKILSVIIASHLIFSSIVQAEIWYDTNGKIARVFGPIKSEKVTEKSEPIFKEDQMFPAFNSKLRKVKSNSCYSDRYFIGSINDFFIYRRPYYCGYGRYRKIYIKNYPFGHRNYRASLKIVR